MKPSQPREDGLLGPGSSKPASCALNGSLKTLSIAAERLQWQQWSSVALISEFGTLTQSLNFSFEAGTGAAGKMETSLHLKQKYEGKAEAVVAWRTKK